MLAPFRLFAAAPVAMVSFAALAAPPLFSTEPYEEARARAGKEGKLFIVDATAEWCGPCKQMDRTTWVDPEVVSWFERNAVAVQVDVDHQKPLAKSLGIRAMPTIIVFNPAGEEVDRVVGGRDAHALLGWLEGTRTGKTQLEVLRENAGDRAGPDGRVNVQARMELARELANKARHDEAADEYVWLWNNMLDHEPAYAGVRGSFMAGEMTELASESERARAAFAALRDEAGARLKADPTWRDLDDWVTLNGVIGDDDATLAWIDRVKGDEDGRASIRRLLYEVEELLIRHERWTDYGTLVRNPATEFRREVAMAEQSLQWSTRAPEEQKAMIRAAIERRAIDRGATLHASLLAAAREDEAWDLADEVLKTYDRAEARHALVENALRAGVATARHRDLLTPLKDEASVELLTRLNRALEKRGG